MARGRLLPAELRQYARTLGLELVPVPVSGNILLGAFEIQTGIQVFGLPEMVNGHWRTWEGCSEGVRYLEGTVSPGA